MARDEQERDPRARVLVVEDDDGIRRGLVSALRFAGHPVVATGLAAEALTLARREPPELALIDIMLPDGDGLDVLADLRRAFPRLPVILLTARGSEDDRVRGLTLGADDYVVKPFSARELLARVDAVLRRSAERAAPGGRLRAGSRSVDLARREILLADGVVVQLSDREAELLRYLAAHAGRVVPRQELLSQLWGCDATDIESRSVDMAVARLREKLEDDPSRPAFVVTVRAQGYVLGRDVEREP